MRSCYSYIRYSTPEQARGASLARQLEQSRKWADENGYRLDETLRLRDEGISAFRGTNAKTGALAAFRAAVDDGRVEPGSVLIVESLDRLSRDEVGEALELFLGLLRRGLTIVTLTPAETFDRQAINDTVRLISALLVMSRAHEESATKSQRVGHAWARLKDAARGGRKITAACPSWLRLVGDQFELVPHQVNTVQEIFALYLDGLGVGAIVRRLNAEQRPTLRGRRPAWHSSSVRKVLTFRAVLGEYQPHVGTAANRQPVGEVIKGYYPQIIDDVSFDRVQALLLRRRTRASGASDTRGTQNLFTGLLVDGADGSQLVRIDKGKRGQPQLINADSLDGVNGAHRLAFPYRSMEFGLLSYLSELQPKDLVGHRNQAQASAREQALSEAEASIARIDARLATLAQALVGDRDPVAEVLAGMKRLDAERRELYAERDRLRATLPVVPNALGETRTVWSLVNATGDANERHRLRARLKLLIAELIDRAVITLTKDGPWKRAANCVIRFRSGAVRRVEILAVTAYVGGGKQIPRPVQRTYARNPERRGMRLMFDTSVAVRALPGSGTAEKPKARSRQA